MIVLDTNTVSSARRRERADENFLAYVDQLDIEETYITAITVSEILFGIQRKAHENSEFADELTAWLHDQVLPTYEDRILPFTADAALICGRLTTPHKAITSDAMIASIALSHGYKVVTANVAHFLPFGVEIINPFDYRPPAPGMSL